MGASDAYGAVDAASVALDKAVNSLSKLATDLFGSDASTGVNGKPITAPQGPTIISTPNRGPQVSGPMITPVNNQRGSDPLITPIAQPGGSNVLVNPVAQTQGPSVMFNSGSGEGLSEGRTFAGQSIDDLAQAAAATDRGDLTLAGRALQKHGNRDGSAFPSARGNPAAVNEQAQQVVNEILSNPATTATQRNTGRFGQVTDIVAPDGRGLRYDANGKLIGFLEPPIK